ncbi:phage holin family protein [Proteiniborus sp. MB09-C3]|uniref:phage holin family protein n=1 Tax=Proteiniborus sp. MB09-C3 TaxID=3050072 RepID=UPI002557AC40|nr:phage holin family protein [Proteiniborus sp. MB09-C3]WIV10555.1 phage holin family protein [Proteiniborus sp. MB09-C3]
MQKNFDFGVIVSIGGSIVTYLLGGIDSLLQVLLIFIVLDYITGIAKGYVKKELNSTIGFRGILKKALILCVLIIAVQLDKVAETDQAFRTVVAWFYIGIEGISLLENAAEIGLPVPKKLLEALKILKDRGEGGKA